MKKLLLIASSALSLFAVTSHARAADLGLAPSTYDWSGAYIGANVGAGFMNAKMRERFAYQGTDDTFATDPDIAAQISGLNSRSSDSQTAFTGGFSAGYNWQMERVVLGVETDINYLGFSRTERANLDSNFQDIFGTDAAFGRRRISYENDWFGTVRGRIGYAADNLLFYGTAGLAYGKAATDSSTSGEEGVDGGQTLSWESSKSGWNFGWTVGAGMEYGVDNWVLGLEYLYVDLGTYDWKSRSIAGDTETADGWVDVNSSGSMDYSFSVARATVKYRF